MLLRRLRLGAQVLVALTLACSDRAEERIDWGPARTSFPPGAQFAVLQGDPRKPDDIFIVWLRFPDGYIFPPHLDAIDKDGTVHGSPFAPIAVRHDRE